MQMEALRHAVLKKEIAPLLKQTDFVLPLKNGILDESDDEDCQDQKFQAKISSGLVENMKKSHQNLLFTGKDAQNSKKF